jgi:hypothetical protein
MLEFSRPIAGRAVSAAAAVGLAVVLSGCAYSLGDFGLERPQRPADNMAAAALPPQPAPPPMQSAAATTVPLEPTALAEPADPTTTASIGPSNTGTFVTPGVPADQPQNKLLTPEEKARVIAELEGLAKSQKVTPPGAGPTTKCEDETLDPAERLRREREGIAC